MDLMVIWSAVDTLTLLVLERMLNPIDHKDVIRGGSEGSVSLCGTTRIQQEL